MRRTMNEEGVRMKSNGEFEETVIVGGDSGLADVIGLVELAASTDSPALITGETGTGKNLVAKAIHERSAAKREPFLCVNCLSLPVENLAGAELFGCEKGAFTDATAGRKGIFEMADRGTLFLDKIGEMPLSLQGMLLGLIDDQKVRRLGGDFERPVHVRILASSHGDIEKAVGSAFRKDLYYRLNAIRIHIPPLRDRRQDIPALCSHLLKGLSGLREMCLPDSELKKLMEYDWPGNVRELKNVIERAFFLRKGPELRPSEFLAKTFEREAAPGPAGEDRLMTVAEIEKNHIELALQRFSGHRVKAAEALGISLSTINRRLKELGSRRVMKARNDNEEEPVIICANE